MITWHSIQRWRFLLLYINSWLVGMQWFKGGIARAGALPSMIGSNRMSEYIDNGEDYLLNTFYKVDAGDW
jgi:hypothetical protein